MNKPYNPKTDKPNAEYATRAQKIDHKPQLKAPAILEWLGYELHSNKGGYIAFINKTGKSYAYLIIDLKNKTICKKDGLGCYSLMSFAEMLAIHRYLKERGWVE